MILGFWNMQIKNLWSKICCLEKRLDPPVLSGKPIYNALQLVGRLVVEFIREKHFHLLFGQSRPASLENTERLRKALHLTAHSKINRVFKRMFISLKYDIHGLALSVQISQLSAIGCGSRKSKFVESSTNVCTLNFTRTKPN